jgi:hypothetical protein
VALNSFSIASIASLLPAESAAIISEVSRWLEAIACGLHGVVAGKDRRGEDGIDPDLGFHHRRVGRGNEVDLSLAQRAILLIMPGRGFMTFAGGHDQAFDGVVDTLHGSAERGDYCPVRAELDDFAEFFDRDLLGLLDFRGALVQALLAAGRQQRRPLAGKACALRRQLQAYGEAGDVPPAQMNHRAAEMPQHHAGADTDEDRHAGNHGESGEHAAPDAPFRAGRAGARGFGHGGS